MLKDELLAYADGTVYPMHMPGHKRQVRLLPELYAMDITEIDGFDNLHDAGGILKEAMDFAASLFGARKTWFLVNGSTCGLLAGIFAAAKPGDAVLVARNCHKAVYHALMLRGVRPVYLYPELTELGYADAVTTDMVREAFSQQKTGFAACILTSPTYDGVVSDIAGIAEICHAQDCLLVVDEAHGAHLPFMAQGALAFPPSALTQGADLVIQSVHKTLPAPTQTAVLHLMGERIAEETVAQYLDVFETSSPSYPLMAGVDACMNWLAKEGAAAAKNYQELLFGLYKRLNRLKRLTCVPENGRDPGKVLLYDESFGMTGREIYDILKDKFGIQPEMAAGRYCLLMTSLCDTKEGFCRLAKACEAIDAGLAETKKAIDAGLAETKKAIDAGLAETKKAIDAGLAERSRQPMERIPRTEQVLPMMEAFTGPKKQMYIRDLTGEEIAASFAGPYPPGIPYAAPGERIAEARKALQAYAEEEGHREEQIWVSCIS